MDSSNMIGGLSWNPTFRPIGSPAGQGAPVAPPSQPQAQPPSIGDSIDIQASLDLAAPAAPPRFEAAPPASMPAAPAAPATPRDAVPVSLLADDVPTLLGSDTKAGNPLAGLGVLAQLDEPSAMSGVRAIDDRPSVGAFKDLGLIGPSNAGQYLGRTNEMYLGM